MKIQQKTIEKLRNLINEETEYRSGPVLVSFFNSLGFNDSYGQGFPSRWMYTEGRLKEINGMDKLEECIKSVFSPVNFIGKFVELDKFIADFNQYLAFDNYKVVRKNKDILIQPATDLKIPDSLTSEDEFLKKEFKNVALDKIDLSSQIVDVIKQRIEEIKNCMQAKASLAVIFLCGSTLEGILLDIASRHPQKFNESSSSPKDKNSKVKKIPEWSLSELIDVACSIKIIGEDVKKFSHALRDFRNYIHPYQQMLSGFNPDEQTAKICWQVLKAAIYQLEKNNG